MPPVLDHPGTSLWMDTARPPRFAPLQADTTAGVCIVGGGIAGLSAAYTLAGVGHDVVVLDQGGLADTRTARSTGHLCSALEVGYAQLARLRGAGAACEAARSHGAAIHAVEDLCQNEGIDCGFSRVNGFLVGSGDDGAEFAAADRAGLDVMGVPGAPGPMAAFGPAVRFAAQGRLNPLRYLEGLAEAVRRRGVRLHGDTRVVDIERGPSPAARTADGHRVRAEALVVTADIPLDTPLAGGMRPRRSYVVALRVARDEVPDVLLWDAAGSGHYVRVADVAGGSWLLVGGEDRPLGDDDAAAPRHAALEAWAREHFPMAGPTGYRWAGTLAAPADGLACIGPATGPGDNVFVARGGGGNGLTHGVLAGLVLPELVAGRDSPFQSLYAPERTLPDPAG